LDFINPGSKYKEIRLNDIESRKTSVTTVVGLHAISLSNDETEMDYEYVHELAI